MRLLLDQNCPERVGQRLVGHAATPARNLGWDRLSNGELLAAAEAAGFELLLTADQGIRYQQNLAGRRIALVVLSLNSRTVLLQHLGLIQAAVDRATPGSYEEVEIPLPKLLRNEWPKPGQ